MSILPPDHPQYAALLDDFDPCAERIGACPSCGQECIEPDHFGPCDDCRDAAYGGTERHETVRLFEPAPVQMPGQMGFGLD